MTRIPTIIACFATLPHVAAAQIILTGWPFEPDVNYQVRARYARTGQPDESPGVITLRYDDDRRLLVATLELAVNVPPEALEMMGMTPEDLRSTVEFRLDEDRRVMSVANWEALRDEVADMSIRIMAAETESGEVSQQQADMIRQRVRTLISSQTAILDLYGKRIIPYLEGYGLALVAGESQTGQGQLLNPVGGPPLPSITTLVIEDDPATEDLIEFSRTQVIDRESVKEDLAVVAAEMGWQHEELVQIYEKISSEDKTIWAFDPNTRTIRSATYERRMRMPANPELFETWTWELVPGDEATREHPNAPD